MALFAVISVVGILYVGLRYVGADSLIGLGPYTVKVELADSGGIFPDASVSYRGVEIGKVGDMRVTPQGLEVDLEIEQDAPRRARRRRSAVIANRSAVGEQYVDLQPPNDARARTSTRTRSSRSSQTRTPIPVDQLLADVNALATSVPLPELRTTVDELYNAFDRAGPGPAAPARLEQRADPRRDRATCRRRGSCCATGGSCSTTQSQLGPQIISFSRDLQLFTAQLKADDPNLRRLVAAAPPAAPQLEGLIRDAGPDLSRMIANLLTITRIIEPRLRRRRAGPRDLPGAVGGGPVGAQSRGPRRRAGALRARAEHRRPAVLPQRLPAAGRGWRPATAKDFIPMDTSVRCNEAPAGERPRGPEPARRPYDSENPGNPADAGGTGQSQNEQQDTTTLAALPADGVLAGSTARRTAGDHPGAGRLTRRRTTPPGAPRQPGGRPEELSATSTTTAEKAPETDEAPDRPPASPDRRRRRTVTVLAVLTVLALAALWRAASTGGQAPRATTRAPRRCATRRPTPPSRSSSTSTRCGPSTLDADLDAAQSSLTEPMLGEYEQVRQQFAENLRQSQAEVVATPVSAALTAFDPERGHRLGDRRDRRQRPQRHGAAPVQAAAVPRRDDPYARRLEGRQGDALDRTAVAAADTRKGE